MADTQVSRLRGRRVSPTSTVGESGVPVYSGYIQSYERDRSLATPDARHRTYSEILANVSIVAAGVRYFANLVGGANWSFVPVVGEPGPDGLPPDPTGEATRYAELAEAMLTDDPNTPWHRIVRRASMYRFYGFSIQEWTGRRREDGYLTLADVEPRAQASIDRWDTDRHGRVYGVWQRSPASSQEIYIPISKTLYLVDDTLHDSPEGLGLFRHLVDPARRLRRLEQLEGMGYETDLRGIPVLTAPLAELRRALAEKRISEAEHAAIVNPLKTLVKQHIRKPDLGLMLESAPYFSADTTSRPTTAPQYDLKLLTGDSTGFAQVAAAIERINRELARVIGVEQLLLGSDVGSYALSQDKTHAFYLLVDGALTEIQQAVAKSLLNAIWALNGWPPELMPKIETEAVSYTSVAEIAATLRDMATAGAILESDDPVIRWVRDQLGAPPPLKITGEPEGRPDPDPDPDDDLEGDE